MNLEKDAKEHLKLPVSLHLLLTSGFFELHGPILCAITLFRRINMEIKFFISTYIYVK